MAISEIFFDLVEKLLSFARTVRSFLFNPFVEIGTLQLSVWSIIGGVGLTIIIIISVVRR